MSASYTIRRDAEGLPIPFGVAGVAGTGAALLGLAGLLVPIGWIETLSYHLYLDTIISAAAPPLGLTARILFAIALASLGGAAGYVLARLFKVVPSDLVDVLLTRLRGLDRQDEADAPVLRSADRHPDAPARRPFSPLRDIPEPASADDVAAPAVMAQPQHFVSHTRDDEDELLLDSQFAGPAEPSPPADEAVPLTHSHDAAGWAAEEQADEESPPAEAEVPFDLPAPSPEDWEQAAQPVTMPPAPAPEPEPAPEPAADPVMEAPVPQSPPVTAPRAAAPRPQPLDLSVARLDELIARLETGFASKVAAPVAGSPETGGNLAQPESADMVPMEARIDDPAFPHDPALAAALATLRKLNRAG
jgi:hypothetical protein